MKIMYLRKSRADNPYETVEEVLARHEARLQEFAVRAFGQPIPEQNIYREVASGENIDSRPEMQIVLRRMESPDVDGVLVVDPQRLSRGGLIDCGTIMQAFKYSRTSIVTPAKSYDLWDKLDEKIFRDELMRGREYLEYAKEVMEQGRKQSTAEGWYLGSTPPFGYELDHVMVGRKRRQTLKPHPTEAEAVRHIFEWFVYLNMSMYGIARKLETLGFTPRRAEHFTTEAIKHILANPVYTGKIAVGRRKKKESLIDGHVVISRPRQKPAQIINGKHPAIISDSLFEMAQERFGTLPRLKGKTDLRNPLAGLMKCSCGYTMVFHKGSNGESRLVCPQSQHCGSRSINFDRAYNAIIEKLRDCTEDFEWKIDSGINIAAEQYQRDLQQLKESIRDLDVQQDRLFSFLESGTYDEATFRMRNKILVEKRANLISTYAQMAENAPPVVDYEEVVGTLHDAIDAMKVDYLSPQQKNDFLKEVIDKIVYTSLPPIEDGTRWGNAQFNIDIFLKGI